MKKYTFEEIETLYYSPLFALVAKAGEIHSQHHKWDSLQTCALFSVKTGGCPMDCKYCAQSSFYKTSLSPQPMLSYEEVMERAEKAVAKGATRICLGMAIKEVREGKSFDTLLKMVEGIAALQVEVCVTLGKLTKKQALLLKQKGVFAYNHNLDTSPSFYKTIVTTRSFEERLETLSVVEEIGLSLCSGGILGMGESVNDRLQLLFILSQREPQPQSIPINKLVPMKGTPLEKQKEISLWELVRIIAIARILCPRSKIRLGAGRESLNYESQALCFLAGANSLFLGELLTAPGMEENKDREMFHLFGFNGC